PGYYCPNARMKRLRTLIAVLSLCVALPMCAGATPNSMRLVSAWTADDLAPDRIPDAAFGNPSSPNTDQPAATSLPDDGKSTTAPTKLSASGPVDANGDPIPLERLQPTRILGFMPNFRSVSGGSKPPPPTWKNNFVVATHQATDYSSFIFLGLTSLTAEGI